MTRIFDSGSSILLITARSHDHASIFQEPVNIIDVNWLFWVLQRSVQLSTNWHIHFPGYNERIKGAPSSARNSALHRLWNTSALSRTLCLEPLLPFGIFEGSPLMFGSRFPQGLGGCFTFYPKGFKLVDNFHRILLNGQLPVLSCLSVCLEASGDALHSLQMYPELNKL